MARQDRIVPDRVRQQRSPLNMKASPELRAKIEEAAAASGLSLTQEVERRLMDSFASETMYGGRRTSAFLRLIAANIETIEVETGAEWTADYAAWHAVKEIVPSLLARFRPQMPNEDAAVEAAVREARLAGERAEVVKELTELGAPPPQPMNALLAGWKYEPPKEVSPPSEGSPAAERIRELSTRLADIAAESVEAMSASRDTLTEALAAQREGKRVAEALLEKHNESLNQGDAPEVK